jgi:hypothetical protein
MTMTLATEIMGALVLALGIVIFLLHSEAARLCALKVLRSRALDGAIMLVATAWFLWIVSQLGEADFGDYKIPLFAGFLVIAVGSWFYVKDFLGVRAAAALFMLIAWNLLAAAFGHYEVTARLFMVGAVYVGLFASLYFGAIPYRARDLAQWLCGHAAEARVAGAVVAAYGVWLMVVPVLFYK